MLSKYKKLLSFLLYDNIQGRGDYMEKERKAITLRVSPELKFQIEKATAEEGFNTINSWIIHIIKGHLERKK